LSGILTFLGEPAKKLAADGVTLEIDLANSFYIDWGAFINAIINFLIIAFVLFAIVKIMNRLAQARNDIKNDAKLQKEAIKKYRKEGLKRKEAIARYKADLQAEADRVAAEQKAAQEAAANEEKEMDVLKDIRDLLKAQAQTKAE
ncbi:MAG: MscL family protein, partial [Clostridia bacterium]|nr:MscL family protein [Clostridia bacterium]